MMLSFVALMIVFQADGDARNSIIHCACFYLAVPCPYHGVTLLPVSQCRPIPLHLSSRVNRTAAWAGQRPLRENKAGPIAAIPLQYNHVDP